MAENQTRTWRTSYSVGCNFATQGMQVLQAILIARTLGPTGRGELGLIQWAPPLLTVLAGFGLTQALGALVPRRNIHGPLLFWTSYRFAIKLACILCIGAAIAYWLFTWPSANLLPIAWLYLLITPLEIAHSFPREYAIARQKFLLYDILKFSLAGMGLLGVLILAGYSAVNPVWVSLVILLSAGVQVALSWRLMGGILLPSVQSSPAERSTLLKFGGLCMISGFAGVLQGRAFQYIVVALHSIEALGLFLVLSTWGGLGTPLWQAVQVRLYPAIAKAQGEGNGHKAFLRAVWIGAGVCAATIIGGLVFTPWLFPLLLGRQFAGSVSLALLFAIALPLQTYASLLGFGLRALGRAKQALWVDYLSAGSAVVLAVGMSFVTTSLTVYAWAIGAGGVIAIGVAMWIGLRVSQLDQA